MSIEAVSAALRLPIGGNEKLILIGLANHAHPDGTESRPAIATLAAYAHCSERTVQRTLRTLEAGGWIETTGRHALGSRADRSVNVYRIHLERGDNLSPRDERGDKLGVNGVTNQAERGDIAVSPEPSIEPSIEPSTSSFMSEVLVERERSDVNALCDLLAEHMTANDPKAKTAPRSKSWQDAARLLLDRDGRPLDEAKHVLRWCQTDEFWRTNILSMPKFREKYPRLVLQSRARRNLALAAPAARPGARDWRAWAVENVPDLPADMVAMIAVRMNGSGQELTAESVRRATLWSHPGLADHAGSR